MYKLMYFRILVLRKYNGSPTFRLPAVLGPFLTKGARYVRILEQPNSLYIDFFTSDSHSDERAPLLPTNQFVAYNLSDTEQDKGKTTKESSIRAIAARPAPIVLQQLQSSIEGITDDEASRRLKEDGANILSTTKPSTWWQLLIRAIFFNPFNILLACLTIISVATPEPEWPTFGILLIMITISCTVSFWQEYKSSVAAFKLTSSVPTEISVRRLTDVDGDIKSYERHVDTAEIVCGDVLSLSPGDSAPADCDSQSISSSGRTVQSDWRERPSTQVRSSEARRRPGRYFRPP